MTIGAGLAWWGDVGNARGPPHAASAKAAPTPVSSPRRVIAVVLLAASSVRDISATIPLSTAAPPIGCDGETTTRRVVVRPLREHRLLLQRKRRGASTA